MWERGGTNTGRVLQKKNWLYNTTPYTSIESILTNLKKSGTLAPEILCSSFSLALTLIFPLFFLHWPLNYPHWLLFTFKKLFQRRKYKAPFYKERFQDNARKLRAILCSRKEMWGGRRKWHRDARENRSAVKGNISKLAVVKKTAEKQGGGGGGGGSLKRDLLIGPRGASHGGA